MAITRIQRLTKRFIHGLFRSGIVWTLAIALPILWAIAPMPAPALSASLQAPQLAGLQSPQMTEQPATLVGPRADSPIAIYLRPAPNQPNVGYGISGDAVTVTEQVGDYLSEGDQNATWSHIRLNKAPYTEGWLRGRYLSFDSPTDPDASLEPSTDQS